MKRGWNGEFRYLTTLEACYGDGCYFFAVQLLAENYSEDCLPMKDDGSFRITWPATGRGLRVPRAPDRVQTFHELCSSCQGLQDGGSDASHDSHRTHHIWWVRNLNADLWQWWADWTHAEGDDVHGAACKCTRLAHVRSKWHSSLHYNSSLLQSTQVFDFWVFNFCSQRHENSKQIIWECVTIQILGDVSNKSKSYSRGDWILAAFATARSRTFCLPVCCRKT
jgi:hypothetical protein